MFKMNKSNLFSVSRWWAIVVKEFLQLKRDRLTFGMIIGIPIIQLLLFGYAINNDPKHLPTALVVGEQTSFTRSFEQALKNSEYYDLKSIVGEKEAKDGLLKGNFQFVISIPINFSQDVLRGKEPQILIEADATDPMAVGGAVGALEGIIRSVVQKEFKGSASFLLNNFRPFSVIVHKLYNPEGITHYNIVPVLMGVVLTMTTVMMTSLAVTRERERGTMENILAMPVNPFEIMSGKIVPYIFIAHIQVGIIACFARLLFHVPFFGDGLALYFATALFIIANLSVGILISSLAKNQLQSMQMTIFYFLPNIMLSGFMFPFAGMPKWAQCIGNILPLTYFNRAVRGAFLKGSGWQELMPNIIPLAFFCCLVLFLATKIFKRTLD